MSPFAFTVDRAGVRSTKVRRRHAGAHPAVGAEPPSTRSRYLQSKPNRPTPQRKNERFHQTLFRYLDKQPLAANLAQPAGPGRRVRPHLQHRAPPPRTTRPRHTPDRLGGHGQSRGSSPQARAAPGRPAGRQTPTTAPMPTDLPAGTHGRKLTSAGTFWLARIHYIVGGPHGFQQVLVITDGDKITVGRSGGRDPHRAHPTAPWVKYVCNGRHPGPQSKTPEPSPKS